MRALLLAATARELPLFTCSVAQSLGFRQAMYSLCHLGTAHQQSVQNYQRENTWLGGCTRTSGSWTGVFIGQDGRVGHGEVGRGSGKLEDGVMGRGAEEG